MKDTEVELLGFSEMPHTGHERLPERAVIGALRQDLVDGRVMEGWCAMGICRHGPALPWHPGVEHPQDEVKDAIIAQFARGTALGHREVRQDPGGERRCGELDGNWRRYRLWGWGAHSAMASCEG